MPLTTRFMARAFSPPTLTLEPTREWISHFRGIMVFTALIALSIDAGILFFLGDPAVYNQSALRFFGWTNIPLLTGMLFVALVGLRPGSPLQKPAIYACAGVLVFTSFVWIQLTGSLTSYFLFVILAGLIGFRVYLGFTAGAFVFAFSLSLHLGIFFLEELAVIPRASLFLQGPGPLYESALLRWFAYVGEIVVMVVAYAATNMFISDLVSAHRSLSAAQKKLAKVAEGLRQGRLTGKVLQGRYVLQDVMGRGGMGEVYRARAADDHRDYAVKVLHPHMTGNERAIARFEREAEAAAKIPGGVAPEVFGLHTDDSESEVFLVLEFLSGEDLAAFLKRRRRLPPGEAASLIGQIATQVDAAHASGIIHRDLKPSNVFLQNCDTGPPRIRLLDFGISKLLESDVDLTLTNEVLGTPGYMSPEQLLGSSARVGPASDIFSLGAIAYTALTGERPFRARELTAAAHELFHTAAKFPSAHVPEVTSQMDRAVMKALRVDPKDRYEKAGDLAAAMEEALDEALPQDDTQCDKTKIEST